MSLSHELKVCTLSFIISTLPIAIDQPLLRRRLQ
jgi:hypothetical protein